MQYWVLLSVSSYSYCRVGNKPQSLSALQAFSVAAKGGVCGSHPSPICISWALAVNENVNRSDVAVSWSRLFLYSLRCPLAICAVRTDPQAGDFVVVSAEKQNLLKSSLFCPEAVLGECCNPWADHRMCRLCSRRAQEAPGPCGTDLFVGW